MTTTLTDHHRAADDALQAARAAVEAPTWPRRLTAATEAIDALQAAASDAIFPSDPVPLGAAKKDFADYMRGAKFGEFADRAIELHGRAISTYPELGFAIRSRLAFGQVRDALERAAGGSGGAPGEYVTAGLRRFKSAIAGQLAAGGHELGDAAALLLAGYALAADLEVLRAARSVFEAARAEAERAARIEAAGDLVERLRALPERFLIPVRKGADYRQPRERTTAAELAAELADGQHGGRLDELAAIVIKAEQRRRMGARW